MKRPKIMKITSAQLIAIVNAADILSAMNGTGDELMDKEFRQTVKAIDRFLKSNGLKRNYN